MPPASWIPNPISQTTHNLATIGAIGLFGFGLFLIYDAIKYQSNGDPYYTQPISYNI